MIKKLKFIFTICLSFTYSVCAFADTGTANATDNAPKRIVKWVDSKGVTHYGDKLPVQETGRNNTELSKQGIVVKQNIKADDKAIEVDKDKLAQQHKDNVLLASYTNAAEIDAARDRNLEMDKAALQALTVQKENVAGRLARNTVTAEGYSKQKKPVPAYLQDEIQIAKSESAKLDKQISDRKQVMELTLKRYAEEKMRFIALKEAGKAAVGETAKPASP